MRVCKEGWDDGTAPVTDWTKALKPTFILDVEEKDNYSKVPTLNLQNCMCGLRLCQAQL